MKKAKIHNKQMIRQKRLLRCNLEEVAIRFPLNNSQSDFKTQHLLLVVKGELTALDVGFGEKR